MKQKRISVIIPTYQHADMLPRCLDHLFAQTRLPDEIFVINDGSTDHMLGALEPYLARITLINQKHAGPNVARNRGFHASTGDLLLFCDADVIASERMLEQMEKKLNENPQASYAYSRFRYGWKKFGSYSLSARRLRRRNFIHTTSLIRREHFPGFDPTIKRFQDWDVWLTMLASGHTGVFVPELLFRVATSNARLSISKWRPSIFFSIPWRLIGWTPSSVRYYEEARKIVAKKHGLHRFL